MNDKQANIQILEEKNPVLLKDIADKAVEFDDKRLDESINTNIPISQRFTLPDSKTPYKPFTDYIDVDELANADYNELYDTRQKEADRETQLKYQKDKSANSAFDAYQNEQTAISFKQSALKKKYDTYSTNLEAKYGNNWFNNINSIPQDDVDLINIGIAQKGLEDNYDISANLIKQDK